MDIYTEGNRQQKAPYMNSNMKFNKIKSGIPVPNRVFVGGICPHATDDDLKNVFEKYGSIKGVKLPSNSDGSNRGYGFVTYEKADDVKRLESDCNNLFLNDKRLNIAPAYMKHTPGYASRQDPLIPATPSLYFNSLAYQYQEGPSVYPSPYAPPVTVVPQIPEQSYYHTNNYAIPTTPYQGAALFYPLHSNAPQIVVGHQTYAPPTTNVSNYVHSSPGPTSSPSSSSTKSSNTMPAMTNSSDIHVPHSLPIVAATAPANMSNVSTVPPPIPYQLTHPPHCYNNNIIPPYSGEVFYNMVHGACFPMVINGQETAYIPYYEAGHETCNNNIHSEVVHAEPVNNFQQTAAVIEVSEMNLNNLSVRDSSPNSNNSSNECKSMPPTGPPPPNTEHARDNIMYSPENSSPSNSTTPPTNVVHINDYNPSSFVQHRAALLYPNPPIPQQNVYFNSAMYVTDATNAPINQCPYSKAMTDHFVSDHLPKRDQKFAKKYIPQPLKDTPPNIPEFPFYNNSYPGYVNRNVKEKDAYKNVNGKNGDIKQSQRGMVRNIPNGGGGIPPKPRIFHNQNQYGGPARPLRNDRNTHIAPTNGQYMKNSPRMPRSAYDQTAAANCYTYQNNNFPAYNKGLNTGHKRPGYVNNNNNNYRNKNEKCIGNNNNNNNNNENMYVKNAVEERSKKCQNQSEENEEQTQVEQQSVDTDIERCDQQLDQEQQVCVEMQNLTV